MVTTFWSVKGGVGVSTVAALWALATAGSARATLLVDLAGDQPTVLGQPPPSGPGVAEWTRAPDADAAALERIATPVTVDLSLVHRGDGQLDTALGDRADKLAAALSELTREVVVDAGCADGRAGPIGELGRELVARSPRSILVVRACYLNLRAAADLDPAPDGVVLVRERGRALGVADVETVIGAPVVARIDWDPAIARCVDAGLATSRAPRGLLRALARVQRSMA